MMAPLMMNGDADFVHKPKTPAQIPPIGLYRMQPSRNSS